MLVYIVTNTINNKQYVGWTSYSVEKRWDLHKTRKNCKAMRSAIDKYGADKFNVRVMFSVETKELAGALEKALIKIYKTKAPNGYNLTDGGEGVKGLPDDIRIKRNKALLGNVNALGAARDSVYRATMSEAQKKRFINSPVTEESKLRMSEAAKGKIISQEARKKISEASRRLGLRPPVLSSEELSRAGRISGHKRYHVKRGIIKPECSLCKEAQCKLSPPPVSPVSTTQSNPVTT